MCFHPGWMPLHPFHFLIVHDLALLAILAASGNALEKAGHTAVVSTGRELIDRKRLEANGTIGLPSGDGSAAAAADMFEIAKVEFHGVELLVIHKHTSLYRFVTRCTPDCVLCVMACSVILL